MKFKKPKNVVNDLALVGGLAVGSMVSKGVYGLIPAQTSTTAIYATRGAIAVAFGATGMFVSGDDVAANLTRGAAFGAAITQVLELVKDVAKDSGVKSESESEGQIGKFVARMVGLGCPSCEGESFRPVNQIPESLNRYRSLRGVVSDYAPSPERIWESAIRVN